MATNVNKDQRRPAIDHQYSAAVSNTLEDKINGEPGTQTSEIDPQDVPSASGDSDPITTEERKRVDSLSQQSSTRARAPSFIQDTENPEINRSGSLVRARAPSIVDTIRDSRIRERQRTRAKPTILSDPNNEQSFDGASSNEDKVNKREDRDVLTAPSGQVPSESPDRKAGDVQPTLSAQVRSKSDCLSAESTDGECNDIQTVTSVQVQPINSPLSEVSEREHHDTQSSSLVQQKENCSSRSESTSSEKSLSSYDGDPGLPSSQEETSVNCTSELWFGGMAN